MPGRDLWRLVRGAVLVAEVAATSLLVRGQLALLPVGRVLGPQAWLRPIEPRAGADALAGRLQRGVSACLGRRPLRARCLVRALVLRQMLRRRSLPCQLVISVRQDGDRLAAHAEARVPRPGEAAASLELLVLR
jgi:hypothetical protein